MRNLKVFLALSVFLLSGCVVSLKKYNLKADEAMKYQAEAQSLNDKMSQLSADYNKLSSEKEALDVRIAEMEKDNQNLNSALSATQNEKDSMISELSQKKQDLETQIVDLESRIKALDEEKAALAKEKEAAINELKGTYDSLVNDLQSEIKQGEIQITQLEGKLTVNMVDKILFNSGEAEVNEKGQQTLVTVGTILKKTNDKQIMIEGHTDNVPISEELKKKYPSNWELSTARATNVARYIIEKVGVDPKSIVAAGYADTRPVASNDTVEGKAKNRRIEIVLTPQDILKKKPVEPPVQEQGVEQKKETKQEVKPEPVKEKTAPKKKTAVKKAPAKK